MPEKRRNITKVLSKFKFIPSPGRGDHTKFSRIIEIKGRKTKLRTQIDSEKDIPDGTFHAILKQVKLNHGNYPDALRCPYRIQDYEKDLIGKIYS